MGRRASQFEWNKNDEMLFSRNHGKSRVTRIQRQLPSYLFRCCFPPCESEQQQMDSNSVNFCISKARVAPMKAVTIPKLEVHATLSAGRLKDEIQQALTVPVERTFMWTDSTTVLQWLHSIDKKPIFVTNRVAELLELTTYYE